MDEMDITVRWPHFGDSGRLFEAGGGLEGRVSLRELLLHHDPPVGRYTWVAERGGELLGIATAAADPPDLEIEFLARNWAIARAPGVSVGGYLVAAAEKLASALGLKFLRLESLDDDALLGFYLRNGFARAGPPLFDASWGILHPMRKPIPALRS